MWLKSGWIRKLADKSEMCFPDENYDYDKMAENSTFIGAYDNNVCIGLAIIQKGSGYLGLYTQGQDNNLGACLFYIKNHFYIGGFDTNVYKGTKQEGKSDIIFYCDC